MDKCLFGEHAHTVHSTDFLLIGQWRQKSTVIALQRIATACTALAAFLLNAVQSRIIASLHCNAGRLGWVQRSNAPLVNRVAGKGSRCRDGNQRRF
jgi:hypothetical protein